MAGRKKVSREARATKAPTSQGAKRDLTHQDITGAAIRIDPMLRRRSQLLWEDRSPATRGPKAGLTPDDVVQAAIAIADDEGLTAVTMNAVATKVGFTTMAIYRYFPNKEALLDAIIDAGMGLPPRLAEPRDDWRSEVTRWAHAKRAMMVARPWLAELPFVAAPHGPNWLSWLEAVADSLSRTGISGVLVGQMLSIIDGYTRGASDTAISLARAQRSGTSTEQWAAAVGADLGRAIDDPRFPAFAGLLSAPADGRSWTMDESFDFGLQRVLDGMELYITSRSAVAK